MNKEQMIQEIQNPQLNKLAIRRSVFLKLNFPILPYCEITRGPSTQFNESIHIENRNTGIILNFYWRNDGTVSVGRTNLKETNPFKKADIVLPTTKKFNQATIIDLFRLFL